MELGNRTKEFDVVGFGEIMLRLSPTGLERMSQCETLEKRPGGSELNVVSGISLLGLRTAVITKVPDNDMGRFIKNKIRFYGVSDDCLIYDQSDKKRIGIYYYESGAYPRKPAVMYDRAYSSINSISVDEINPAIYQDTRVFHTSGISLALSRNCRTAAVEMIKQFKAGGAAISFDVNYRANLWDEEEARKTIYEILPYVDVLFVSEETSRRMIWLQGGRLYPAQGQKPQVPFVQLDHLSARGGQALHWCAVRGHRRNRPDRFGRCVCRGSAVRNAQIWRYTAGGRFWKCNVRGQKYDRWGHARLRF